MDPLNQQWGAVTTYQPQIVTSAGTNVYVTPGVLPQPVFAPAAHKEPTPLEWLRDQVDEMCGLAGAA